jgi:hypothetical protein
LIRTVDRGTITHSTGSLFNRVGCPRHPRMITYISRQILYQGSEAL